MFTELAPLLEKRTLMLTLARLDKGLIRLNVIPARTNGEGKSSDTADPLTQPLTITGSPEELDRGLAAQLNQFVALVSTTGSNLDELKAQHDAAIKAIDAENKKKQQERKTGTSHKTPPVPENPSPLNPTTANRSSAKRMARRRSPRHRCSMSPCRKRIRRQRPNQNLLIRMTVRSRQPARLSYRLGTPPRRLPVSPLGRSGSESDRDPGHH